MAKPTAPVPTPAPEPPTDAPADAPTDEPETPGEDVSAPELKTAEEVQAATGGLRRINLSDELRKIEEMKGGEWTPKTRLGQLVKSGKISSMSQALASGLPLREPEIVDILLPDMADEVTSVNMVQRMSDSGRRVRFSIQCVVGNRDGFVGVGMAKGREVGPSIRSAIDNAKLNLIEVRRGCGSWECGCGTPHTVPFQVVGRSGSTEIVVRPAPRGVGLAVGPVARKVFALAGIKDAWSFARGQTRTTVNFTGAAFDALKRVRGLRVRKDQLDKLKISTGAAAGAIHTHMGGAPEVAPAPGRGGGPS